jgi:CRISPR-associated helicase Cas3/CRISPR-associated endonuclease Cas3-HD
VYYAHTHDNPALWQPLREHASEVARLASARAGFFGEAESARVAGLFHDIGKYGDLFQRRLRGEEKGLDHWSAGADIALRDYQNVYLAAAIQGHHIGLQGTSRDACQEMLLKNLQSHHPLGLRLTETDTGLLKRRLAADLGTLPDAEGIKRRVKEGAASMLDTRMLFSALVDADYLDTERAMHQGDPNWLPRPVAPPLQAGAALELVDAYLGELQGDPKIPAKTRAVRRQLADLCLEASRWPEHIFTLTAPTGSGKTLAMLRFALARATHDPKVRRIIVVLPFLSILDQTVGTYRQVLGRLGEHYILEHHSLDTQADHLSKENVPEYTREQHLLAENWEAPVIITTSVQFLESLHASRPSVCRKLHNIAGSVVLFDEVQTLPAKLAIPTLKTLSHLATDKYGCTVVFSTATQPAFSALDPLIQQGEPPGHGWRPRELVPDHRALFTQLKRVKADWRLEQAASWEEVLSWIKASEQALCIVNLKRHASQLTLLAQQAGLEGLYHLSTALCPAHRRRQLDRIRRALAAGEPCRVLATQCVEAGVDLDFPKVFRALGPLDSVAQASGRCNRNGLLEGGGELVVFKPEEQRYPSKAYQQAAEVAQNLVRALGSLDLDDPQTYQSYYAQLYTLARLEDEKIAESMKAQNFSKLSEQYRLIEQRAVNVVVPYDGAAEALMAEGLQGIHAGWIRRARQYSVPLYLGKKSPSYLETLFFRGPRGQQAEDWYLCQKEDPFTLRSYYDPMLGLLPEEAGLEQDTWQGVF